jgi:hypothetical protein
VWSRPCVSRSSGNQALAGHSLEAGEVCSLVRMAWHECAPRSYSREQSNNSVCWTNQHAFGTVGPVYMGSWLPSIYVLTYIRYCSREQANIPSVARISLRLVPSALYVSAVVVYWSSMIINLEQEAGSCKAAQFHPQEGQRQAHS